jgi:hypothetical protein
MLTRFHRIVGVGTIKPRRVDSQFNAKPQWRWIATKRCEAEHVLRLFEPWLSARRLEYAATLFDGRGNLVSRKTA